MQYHVRTGVRHFGSGEELQFAFFLHNANSCVAMDAKTKILNCIL